MLQCKHEAYAVWFQTVMIPILVNVNIIREECVNYQNCYVDDTNYLTKKMIEVEYSSRGNDLVIDGLK